MTPQPGRASPAGNGIPHRLHGDIKGRLDQVDTTYVQRRRPILDVLRAATGSIWR
jgi:hypothetical protein